MANVTLTTAAKYLAEKWTREVEEPFDKAIYAADLVTRHDGLVTDGGTKINIPFVARVTARDKAASTEVTFDANTETEVELSINKNKYFAWRLENIVKVQASYNLQTIYRNRGMVSVAEALDSDLLGLHASAGTNVAGGATADDADILAVITALDQGEVPQTDRAGIVGHKVMNDLRAVNKYSAYDQTGKTGLAVSGKAAVASVYGVDIYQSGNVVDDATNTHNLFFHKSGLGLAVQQKPKFDIQWSTRDIAWDCVVHSIYGVAVLRAAAVVDLERAS